MLSLSLQENTSFIVAWLQLSFNNLVHNTENKAEGTTPKAQRTSKMRGHGECKGQKAGRNVVKGRLLRTQTTDTKRMHVNTQQQ